MNNFNSPKSLVQKLALNLNSSGFKKGILLAFILGFAIRPIPEILSFPYPIGWDTIYYASRIQDGTVLSYWGNIFSTWLIYGILVTLGNLTRLEPFMLLKLVAPLLYGGASAGIFFVASKKLSWNTTKSLLTAGFFVFQLAALTISWHYYRNIFGVTALLFTIPFLKNELSLKQVTALSVLSLVVVWGHELAAVSLFVMVFGLLFMSVYKKEQLPTKPVLATIPALAVFLIGVLRVFPLPAGAETNILQISDTVLAHPGGLFFLTDYLNVLTPVEHYTSYFELFSHVSSLFILLYLVLIPLIAVGYFKDRVLGYWTLLLLVGSFSCLVVPFSGLFLWNRWMLMLIFPFTFFAVEGLWKAAKTGSAFSVSRFFRWFRLPKKFGVALAFISVVVGMVFMTYPLVDGKYGIIGVEATFRYVPSTMQSSSVPLQDTQGTIESFDWLNQHMVNNSAVLVHDVFNYWSQLYLDDDHSVILFNNNLAQASQFSSENGFTISYLVWWNQDIGWYNLDVPNNAVPVFDCGRISVFQLV
ncbi:MAG: hypothetical protein WC325_03030 [Candidatus Bathyarchaeia archaeon]|jgi:hypothetical protein